MIRNPITGRLSPEPSLRRFWVKVNFLDNGCWEWVGCCSTSGYGLFWHNKQHIVAHRFSYETFNGTIPDGLQLDHLCRNRRCVNPNHLEAVTQQENTLRGLLPEISRQRMKSRTHCPQNHPYSGENLYVHKGKRYCRICGRIRTAQFERLHPRKRVR